MRVLHITTNYPTEERPAFGAFVRSQVESLRAAGAECEVFFLDGQGSVRRYLRSCFRLLRHLLTHRYDVLHCHHALSGILLCLTGAPLFSRTVLSYQNSPDREWGALTFYGLYPFFRRIILKSPNPAYALFPKVVVLPNGCSAQLYRPMDRTACKRELGLDENSRYILFVDANPRRGRTGQKREDRFDAVIDRLHGAAALSQASVRPLQALKLRDVAPERMPLYYNAAELYLLTSDYEGSPNAAKECLMCNVPVVATPVGDLPFLSAFCPGCRVAETFSEEELADLVLSVMEPQHPGAAVPDAEDEPERMYPTSREGLLALGYSLEATAQNLLQIYGEVC